jgi:DnaJ family protein C protein 2
MKKLEEKSNDKSKTLLSNITNQNSKPDSAAALKVESLEWTDEEVKLLVKGAQVIPMGTRDRWDVIANFIKEHSRGKFVRTGKEVLTKTKDIQRLDPTSKEEANKRAFEKAVQDKKADVEVKDKPSERYISKPRNN